MTAIFDRSDKSHCLAAGPSGHGRPRLHHDIGLMTLAMAISAPASSGTLRAALRRFPVVHLIIDRSPENGCICWSYRVSFQPSKKNKSEIDRALTSGRRL